ncbi:MAG TPA: type II toxin-antitoxin system VapC family toxin [archaeon]|nr:type II toxin-antitoxin system VapC family toxin [archaeon]
MKFLDSNVPIEVLLKSGKDFNEAFKIMESVQENNESVAVSPFILAEMFHILRRQNKSFNLIKETLLDFLDSIGLTVLAINNKKLNEIIELSAKYEIDFVDASNKILMDEHGIKEIYSFDKDFDKFKNIKRLTSLK